MRLGIIGMPQAGKSTIFSALTGVRGIGSSIKAPQGDQRIGTVQVIDDRVNLLTRIFKPKKTTFTQVEYLLPSGMLTGGPAKGEGSYLNQVRPCDALIHVLQNFHPPGGMAPEPEKDFWSLEEEMILNDLMVVDKRIERVALDRKRGIRPDEKEVALIESCKSLLETNSPIRTRPELAMAQPLRGYTFLSAKPQLVIMNNDDEDEALPAWDRRPEKIESVVVRGRLEMEIAAMSPEEAEEFRTAYHIQQTALDRVIRLSYELLNLISFFTVVHDEVRAWTVVRGTKALEAAGTVHSDMQRGFIKAEVLSFEHLKTYGSFQEAKKAGHVRLEGKDCEVQDGDIINFRFNI